MPQLAQDGGNDRNVEKHIYSEDAEIRIEIYTRLMRQVPGKISKFNQENKIPWSYKDHLLCLATRAGLDWDL